MMKILVILLLLSTITPVFAEESILITQSTTMTEIIFDGKWSFKEEWKNSSEDKIILEDGKYLYLKSAHQDDFVYFQINYVSDTTENISKDKAMICFDTENNKSTNFDSNDFCFVIVHKDSTYILKENKKSLNNLFEKFNNKKFVGVSEMSDRKDRYSNVPHMTYEFKIPTDIVGRSSEYGFGFLVYDEESKKGYFWPALNETNSNIPSPIEWGNLISPDKSLPEFSFIFLMFSIVSGISITTIITKIKFSNNYLGM